MLFIFSSRTLDFKEPVDYKITPVTRTNVFRAKDGTVHSHPVNLNDNVELTWLLADRKLAAVVNTALYENLGQLFKVESRYFSATLFFEESELPIAGDLSIDLSLTFQIIDYRPVG